MHASLPFLAWELQRGPGLWLVPPEAGCVFFPIKFSTCCKAQNPADLSGTICIQWVPGLLFAKILFSFHLSSGN